MRAFDAACTLLARSEPPTAIFAVNDQSALGVIAAAREHGLRVPRDLSVVGFDDIPMASQVHPPLTTIRQPFAQMGRAAVNTLLSQMENDDSIAPRIVLPTELIVRQSTAPAPRQATSRTAGARHRARA
jgi:LacI family transcriptional regulator